MKTTIAKTALISTLAFSTSLSGCTSKELKEFQNLLKSGEYVEAVSYYSENKDGIKEDRLIGIVKSTVDDIYNDYYNKEITANSAKSNLGTLISIGADGMEVYINEKLEAIDRMETSRISYAQGESCYKESAYGEAIEYYSNVIEEDLNYTDAQQKMEQCRILYKESVLNEVQAYMEIGNYKSAITALNQSMDKFEDKTELKEKLDECERSYKEELYVTAESYADDEDYKGAADYLQGYVDVFSDSSEIQEKIDNYNEQYEDAVLDEKLEDARQYINNGDFYSALESIYEIKGEYPDNENLKEFEESTKTAYLNKIIPLIDEYIVAEKYSDAYSICISALELIPDSLELQERLEFIEPLKPVLLSELKISESEYFEQLTEHKVLYEDVVGNTYNPGNLFRLHLYHDGWGGSQDGYAKIYLNAQYATLSGIVALEDSSETGSCIVTIYGDDAVLYTGTYDRTSPPQSISVDVTGKQWLEFAITYPEDHYGYTSEILLSGFGFSK